MRTDGILHMDVLKSDPIDLPLAKEMIRVMRETTGGASVPLIAHVLEVPTITPEALAYIRESSGGQHGKPSVSIGVLIPGTPTARVVTAKLADKIAHPMHIADTEEDALAWIAQQSQTPD
jgi:hypothetical protein